MQLIHLPITYTKKQCLGSNNEAARDRVHMTSVDVYNAHIQDSHPTNTFILREERCT